MLICPVVNIHSMTDTLKIALAQLNPKVGDIAGNAAKIREARGVAAGEGADLVVFSELFLGLPLGRRAA